MRGSVCDLFAKKGQGWKDGTAIFISKENWLPLKSRKKAIGKREPQSGKYHGRWIQGVKYLK